MDQIFITDLLVNAIIGVNPDERLAPQELLINVCLYCDTRQVGESDRIEDTVSYSLVAMKLRRYTEQAYRFTVEALAADLARICLEEHGVEAVRVRVEKPTALPDACSAGVEIFRNKNPATV